jgi:hypothetical protein
VACLKFTTDGEEVEEGTKTLDIYCSVQTDESDQTSTLSTSISDLVNIYWKDYGRGTEIANIILPSVYRSSGLSRLLSFTDSQLGTGNYPVLSRITV